MFEPTASHFADRGTTESVSATEIEHTMCCSAAISAAMLTTGSEEPHCS